jgi:hypothetical protein
VIPAVRRPTCKLYGLVLELRDAESVKVTAFFDSIAFNDFWQCVRSFRRISPPVADHSTAAA